MLSIFRKKRKISNKIETDFHSHLIPGIDDGASNLEESLKLIKMMHELGYKKLILTPHTAIETFPNTKKNILKNFELLKDTIKKAKIEIELEIGSEYFLDQGFLLLIEEEQLLPIDKEYVLFETSRINKPSNLEDAIYQLKIKGYKPVIAHPERYRYILNCEKEYKELKRLGALFQVNLNSFNGYYGKEAKEKAMFLMKEGLIDFLGSDIHKFRHVENLQKVLQDLPLIEEIFSKNKILNNTLFKKKVEKFSFKEGLI